MSPLTPQGRNFDWKLRCWGPQHHVWLQGTICKKISKNIAVVKVKSFPSNDEPLSIFAETDAGRWNRFDVKKKSNEGNETNPEVFTSTSAFSGRYGKEDKLANMPLWKMRKFRSWESLKWSRTAKENKNLSIHGSITPWSQTCCAYIERCAPKLLHAVNECELFTGEFMPLNEGHSVHTGKWCEHLTFRKSTHWKHFLGVFFLKPWLCSEEMFHRERHLLAAITSSPLSPPMRKRSSPVTEGHATDKRGMICKIGQRFKIVDWEKIGKLCLMSSSRKISERKQVIEARKWQNVGEWTIIQETQQVHLENLGAHTSSNFNSLKNKRIGCADQLAQQSNNM